MKNFLLAIAFVIGCAASVFSYSAYETDDGETLNLDFDDNSNSTRYLRIVGDSSGYLRYTTTFSEIDDADVSGFSQILLDSNPIDPDNYERVNIWMTHLYDSATAYFLNSSYTTGHKPHSSTHFYGEASSNFIADAIMGAGSQWQYFHLDSGDDTVKARTDYGTAKSAQLVDVTFGSGDNVAFGCDGVLSHSCVMKMLISESAEGGGTTATIQGSRGNSMYSATTDITIATSVDLTYTEYPGATNNHTKYRLSEPSGYYDEYDQFIPYIGVWDVTEGTGSGTTEGVDYFYHNGFDFDALTSSPWTIDSEDISGVFRYWGEVENVLPEPSLALQFKVAAMSVLFAYRKRRR